MCGAWTRDRAKKDVEAGALPIGGFGEVAGGGHCGIGVCQAPRPSRPVALCLPRNLCRESIEPLACQELRGGSNCGIPGPNETLSRLLQPDRGQQAKWPAMQKGDEADPNWALLGHHSRRTHGRNGEGSSSGSNGTCSGMRQNPHRRRPENQCDPPLGANVHAPYRSETHKPMSLYHSTRCTKHITRKNNQPPPKKKTPQCTRNVPNKGGGNKRLFFPCDLLLPRA